LEPLHPAEAAMPRRSREPRVRMVVNGVVFMVFFLFQPR